MTPTEQVRDHVAAILAMWYGDAEKEHMVGSFIFACNGLTYHQAAAQAVLRALFDQAQTAEAEIKALPEGRQAVTHSPDLGVIMPAPGPNPVSTYCEGGTTDD